MLERLARKREEAHQHETFKHTLSRNRFDRNEDCQQETRTSDVSTHANADDLQVTCTMSPEKVNFNTIFFLHNKRFTSKLFTPKIRCTYTHGDWQVCTGTCLWILDDLHDCTEIHM